MKKRIGLFLLLWLMTVSFAAAESAFSLDTATVQSGMPRSYAQGYTPSISNHVMTLIVPVQSPQASGAVEAALTMDFPEQSPFKGTLPSVKAYSDKGVYTVRMELPLLRDRMNGDYPATLHLRGTTAAGASITGEIPLMIRIRDGQANTELPAPRLENVSASLVVGENGTITAVLKNDSATQCMSDVWLTMQDSQGDVLPLHSNLLALPDLAPGEKAEIAFPVTLQPTASASLHLITLTVQYRNLNGQQTWHEQFTMPVSQPMRLENGGVQMAQSILQGDTASLTLPLMNMGKGEVRNVVVTLTLPPITEQQSVLVGTILPGETKAGKLTFTPNKNVLGDVQGTVRVSYEDAYGRAEHFELPVTTSVDAPKAYAASAETAQEEAPTIFGMDWQLAAALGGCVLLVLALAVQGIVLRGKIRRMEEERL